MRVSPFSDTARADGFRSSPQRLPKPEAGSIVSIALADYLDASLPDVGDDRACILTLIAVGFRAAEVASGLDEARAEVRRRHAERRAQPVAYQAAA